MKRKRHYQLTREPVTKEIAECYPRWPLSSDDVIDQLTQIEMCQEELLDRQSRVWEWLVKFPEFAKDWAKFQSAGGVTSSDFAKFMEGTMRHRRTRQRKHLRLVRDNRNVIRRVRLQPSGNDAA
jgi:hypothetical protein